jgi:hypothetical protein
MILLNFAHPLTEAHVARIAELAGRAVERVIAIPAHFDHSRPFVEQAQSLLGSVGLDADQWQSLPMVVNLPSLAPIAAIVLVELHGRCGYFPTVLRLRRSRTPCRPSSRSPS